MTTRSSNPRAQFGYVNSGSVPINRCLTRIQYVRELVDCRMRGSSAPYARHAGFGVHGKSARARAEGLRARGAVEPPAITARIDPDLDQRPRDDARAQVPAPGRRARPNRRASRALI